LKSGLGLRPKKFWSWRGLSSNKDFMRTGRVARVAVSIRPVNRAGSRPRCHEAAVRRQRPVRAPMADLDQLAALRTFLLFPSKYVRGRSPSQPGTVPGAANARGKNGRSQVRTVICLGHEKGNLGWSKFNSSAPDAFADPQAARGFEDCRVGVRPIPAHKC
jgi:hypothetical protein